MEKNFNKAYLIGDLHGNFKPVRSFFERCQPKEDDLLICLGDFSANFFFDYRDDNFKKKLGKYKVIYFVIRGNHEQRPSLLYKAAPAAWHIENFLGGNVIVENEYPYIKYAADTPFIYKLWNKNILTLPGAYSVDKYYRLQNGWSWFEQEQMTEDEMFMGRMIVKAEENWDLVLSHTCPVCYEPTDLFISSIDQSLVDKTMERYLGEIERSISYGLWCWGHYHNTRVYPQFDESNRVMLFNDKVLKLNTYFDTHNPYDALIDIS